MRLVSGRHRQMFTDGAWVNARAGRTMEPPAAA